MPAAGDLDAGEELPLYIFLSMPSLMASADEE